MGLSEKSWGYTPQIQGHGDGKTHHFWLVVSTYPSEKSWSEFVSWDDDIPKIWKNHPNHQADIYIIYYILDISGFQGYWIWYWISAQIILIIPFGMLPWQRVGVFHPWNRFCSHRPCRMCFQHCAKGHISRKSRKVMTFPDFKLCTFVIKMICWMISSSEHNIHVTYRLDECCIFRHHNL